MDPLALLGAITGTIGAVTGTIAFGRDMWRTWKGRKPALQLFTPFWFTGGTEVAPLPSSGASAPVARRRTILFVLVRISNASEHHAHLYLETLKALMKVGREWRQLQVLSSPKGAGLNFDLSPEIQSFIGLQEVPMFNQFLPGLVTRDAPLSCYVQLTALEGQDLSVWLDNDWRPWRLRLEVADSLGRRHHIESEILDNNPQDWKALAPPASPTPLLGPLK